MKIYDVVISVLSIPSDGDLLRVQSALQSLEFYSKYVFDITANKTMFRIDGKSIRDTELKFFVTSMVGILIEVGLPDLDMSIITTPIGATG